MTLHPKERRGHTRRDLLARAGGAATRPLRAQARCSRPARTARRRAAAAAWPAQAPTGPGGLPLARPDKRVTLPRWEHPIASNLQPETGGTFEIFNYPDYLYLKLFKEFCAKYNVTPVYTPFDNIASGIQRLASGSVTPDVMEMTPDNLDQVVAGKLIKPLNLDYIPNLKKNIWPQLVSPFYDVGVALHRPVHRPTPPASCGATTT